jgi:hypothetical protein
MLPHFVDCCVNSHLFQILRDSEQRPEAVSIGSKWQLMKNLSTACNVLQSGLMSDINYRKVDTEVVFPNAFSTPEVSLLSASSF